jgi:BarA-like signal transduction histidine kinase
MGIFFSQPSSSDDSYAMVAERMEIDLALQKINIIGVPSHTLVNLDIIQTSGR